MTRTKEQLALIEQTKQIAAGLAQTFAAFCEVVVGDLLDPNQAVLTVYSNGK
jgi:predicted transcriptional regulator YheO